MQTLRGKHKQRGCACRLHLRRPGKAAHGCSAPTNTGLSPDEGRGTRAQVSPSSTSEPWNPSAEESPLERPRTRGPND